jgi:hypothetical protein
MRALRNSSEAAPEAFWSVVRLASASRTSIRRVFVAIFMLLVRR